MVSAIARMAPHYFRARPSPDLADRVQQALHEHGFFCKKAESWRKELSVLPVDQLRTIIEAICQKEDSLEAMERLSRLIPIEKLQEAVRERYPNQIDALKAAQAMFKEAQQFIDAEKCIEPSLKTRLTNVLEALMIFLESVITSFGVAEFFKPQRNDIDSDFRGQKVALLLSLFTMLSTLLIPVVGASIVAWSIGGALLAISALSLLYPFIRPPANNLPDGENWTQLLKNGKLEAVDGRKSCLDEIARVLIASQRVKTHPMLIGKSGVGKTEAVKAFVQAIQRGDYPELQGKQVIHFNMATLVQHQEMFGAGNRILARISEIMGRHRDKYILVFDEIHYALKEKENSALGEQLKSMLDPGHEKFPYVIGVTTEEEYYRDIYVNHSAFARRFKPIRVENSVAHETLEILSKTLLRQAPQTLMEIDALSYLTEQTNALFPDIPQPMAAQKILLKCIRATADSQHSPLEDQAEIIRSQIESLYAQAAVVTADQNAPWINAVQPLEEQLRIVEMNLLWERNQIERFFHLRDRFNVIKKASMQKVIDAVERQKKSSLSAFLIFNYFKMPLMESRIRTDAKRIGLSAVIDRPLIDQMIAEEQENEKKIQEARDQGREDLKTRAVS